MTTTTIRQPEFLVNALTDQITIKPKLQIEDIDRDDQATWQLLGDGRTKGVFQLENHLGKRWARLTKPTNLGDVGVLTAIIRPGCLRSKSMELGDLDINNDLDLIDLALAKDIIQTEKSGYSYQKRRFKELDQIEVVFGNEPKTKEEIQKLVREAYTKSMTERYADRKAGKEKVTYPHPDLEPILKNTFGILVYQEQSMQIAQVLAGFDLQQADILRKAIGKKKADLMAEVKKDFVDGCLKVGKVSKEQAEEIFSWIQESQRYSFNASHAVAYGLTTYRTAYCKAHYPLDFYAAYIRGTANKQDKHQEIKELVGDARSSDISIKLPDLRDRQPFAYIKDDAVHFGLSDLKGIGPASLLPLLAYVDQTEQEIGKKLANWTWEDYLFYFSHKIGKEVNLALMRSGALDFLMKQRTAMSYEYALMKNNVFKLKTFLWIQENGPWDSISEALTKSSPTKKDGGGCHTAKQSDKILGLVERLANPEYALEDRPDKLADWEDTLLGVTITFRRSEINAPQATSTCRDLLNRKAPDHIILVVEVDSVKEIKTKRGKNPGQSMALVSVSDHTGMINGCIFPAEWDNHKNVLYANASLAINCQMGKRPGDGIIIKDCWEI
jgi:DNA polymerase III alpha subunit